MKQDRSLPANYYVMPLPRSIETGEGTLHLHLGSAYCLDPPFEGFGPLLENQLGLNQGCEDLYFTPSKDDLGEEGYQLKVTKEQVVARATSRHGMFNAIQTIRQLYKGSDGELPVCRIEDAPLHSWRGFMLDCARHFIPVSEIERLIDVAAMHHLNVFHWHLSDDQGWRLPVEGYEKLTEGGLFYRNEEIERIIAFAKERFVTVVPEIDVPGHVGALLLAYPQLGFNAPKAPVTTWGVKASVLNPSSDATWNFLNALLKSLCDLFPGEYLHLGGDECVHDPWLADEGCRKLVAEEKLADGAALQVWFTTKLANLVISMGRTPLVWDDADAEGLPPETVVMCWHKDAIKPAIAHGHKVVACPKEEGCYLDYRPSDHEWEAGYPGRTTTIEQCETFDPASGLSDEEKAFVLGGQGNLWSEYVHSGREAELLLYPRLAVLAERLWQPQKQESVSDRLEKEYTKLTALDIACSR